jgi:hypothetical protein
MKIRFVKESECAGTIVGQNLRLSKIKVLQKKILKE